MRPDHGQISENSHMSVLAIIYANDGILASMVLLLQLKFLPLRGSQTLCCMKNVFSLLELIDSNNTTSYLYVQFLSAAAWMIQ